MSEIKTNKQRGFTIVELLIVIVVIAILATISVVAFSGVQQRARDAQRKTDIAALEKALELYYVDEGQYPPTATSCGSVGMNGWATTADKNGCWVAFMNHLKPYTGGQAIIDPTARPAAGSAEVLNSTNYSVTTYYCARQTYVIQYNDEIPRANPAIEGSWKGCTSGDNVYSNATRHAIIRSKV